MSKKEKDYDKFKEAFEKENIDEFFKLYDKKVGPELDEIYNQLTPKQKKEFNLTKSDIKKFKEVEDFFENVKDA